MARKFRSEDEIKTIIKEMYKRNHVAGLICEFCFLRNMRIADIRFALVSHFRINNGAPEFYLRDDKTEINEWYPIPYSIYQKIQDHIKKQRLKENDFVFEIEVINMPVYRGHKGIITHEYIERLWYSICKKLNFYEESTVYHKNCSKCIYVRPNKKCSVLGPDNIRNRQYIHIKNCKEKGEVRLRKEKHPQLHHSLRGVGAIIKIKHYIEQGMSLEEAQLKVFNMSNWKSWKVFKMYMDSAFDKEQGDKTFIKDWANKSLI